MKASATEIKTHFGHYLNLAKSGEEVIVEHSGKEAAAIIDFKEYQYLKQLDEMLLIEKIKHAEKTGYLNEKDSQKFFQSMLRRLGDELATETK